MVESKKANVAEQEVENMCEVVVNDLKVLREEQSITTAKLSEITDIAQPNITRMETGKSKPNLRTLATIAHALGAEVQIVKKK